MTRASKEPQSLDERIIEIMARAICDFEHGHCGGAKAETFVPGKRNWVFHTTAIGEVLNAIREAGFEVVPREPTEAMHAAANREWDGRMSARSAGVWRAMLEACRR